MKRALTAVAIVGMALSVVATKADATLINGKAAIKVLTEGVILNEVSEKRMDGAFGDYRKKFSVAYKGKIHLCKVETEETLVDVFCVELRMQLK